jgi:hypothetical protein
LLCNPNPELKCATINLYAEAGQIASITGLDEIEKMDDCMMALQQARVGQCCSADTAIFSKIAIVHMCSESAGGFAENLEKLDSLVETYSTEEKDMSFDRVDPDTILHWWN